MSVPLSRSTRYTPPSTPPPPPYTPPGFGAPLSFDNYVSQRPGWLIAKPININMGGNASVSLSRGTDSLPHSSTNCSNHRHCFPLPNSAVLEPSSGPCSRRLLLLAPPFLPPSAGTNTTGADDPYTAGSVDGPGSVHGTTQRGVVYERLGITLHSRFSRCLLISSML